MLKQLADWFTPERRQAIQQTLMLAITLLVTVGAITEGDSQHIVAIAGIILQAGSGLLALAYLEGSSFADMWAVIRGVLYTAAGSAGPVLVALGLLSENYSNWLLSVLGVSLSLVSSVVAIFASRRQEFNRKPLHAAPEA